MCGHHHETVVNRENSEEFPAHLPLVMGSLMGVHGKYYEHPDFAIHITDIIEESNPIEKSIKFYRFLPHLNLNEKTGKSFGGWKLIPFGKSGMYPVEAVLANRK